MEDIDNIVHAVIDSMPKSILDCIESICIVLTFLVAIVSAIYAIKSYNKQQARAKKEAACDLAKKYADEFIPRFQYVTNVMAWVGLLDFGKKAFPLDDIAHFDEDEMNKILEKRKIKRAEADFFYTAIDAKAIYESALYNCSAMIDTEILKGSANFSSDEVFQLNKNQENFLRSSFNSEITTLLNWLEWFSMKARYGVVDEEVIFQSLHQTFISAVWQFYYYIAKSNKNVPGDKFYTNIMWLFSMWLNRMDKIKTKAEENRKRAQKLNEDVRDYEYVGKPV